MCVESCLKAAGATSRGNTVTNASGATIVVGASSEAGETLDSGGSMTLLAEGIALYAYDNLTSNTVGNEGHDHGDCFGDG